MLSFETTADMHLKCIADPEDVPISCEDLVATLAGSSEVNVIGLGNDGAPSFVGNSYARYEVNMTIPEADGAIVTFGIGPFETKELEQNLSFDIEPLE